MKRGSGDGLDVGPIWHCPVCMQYLPACLFHCLRCQAYLLIERDNGVFDVRFTSVKAVRAFEEARNEARGSASFDVSIGAS
eukprot:9338091-Lingulodinium_polyedra.AAC.1